MLLHVAGLILSLSSGQRAFPGWNDQPIGYRKVIEEATRLEVFRLGQAPVLGFQMGVLRTGDWSRDLFHRKFATREEGILSFPILAQYVGPPPGLLDRLREVLRWASYGTYNKFCGPLVPSVGYRFISDTAVVELLICFHCGEADLVSGEHSYRLQIDSIRAELLQLALETFPFDPELGEAFQER